ncbi:AEC family transporter [Aquabacterium sp. OR-4]|uniref:AEC family transporter n=1 Tax=Aquabacterium sp. OR-4 TaxID=2978127 RepID=UPI0028CB060F|nr:AEC family transporter [Aquabacterium sp. OR-4]MDT7834647.1 AEC family transporter [Aquabacterium sp. OR-4]
MLELLNLTGPIFALIGLGWLGVRAGLFDRTQLPALGRFVIGFCIPAMLLRALGQRDPMEVANGRYLLAYAAGSLLALGAGLLWARSRGQPRERAAMSAMGMSCSNSAFVGFPLALQLVGPEAAVAFALTMVVENFLMMPLCLAIADSAAAQHEPLHRAIVRAGWGLRKNPIVLGLVAGVLLGGLRTHAGLALPQALQKAVELMANASAGVSLFYIGGALVGLEAGQGLKTHVAAVSAGKLLLHPLGVAAALWLLGPMPLPLAWSAVVLAGAPMLGIYPILGQRYGLQALNAACMLGATLASFVSLGGLIALLRLVWGPPH